MLRERRLNFASRAALGFRKVESVCVQILVEGLGGTGCMCMSAWRASRLDGGREMPCSRVVVVLVGS